ncbi:MAG: WYL domain-containing protein [Prevotella sp.]|nr:WYL domain-containing protein [Prevotella sp.]
MRHDKLERELNLLLLLTDNRSYTIEKLCDKVGVSRRNLYYYLEFFRDCGFVVNKYGGCYSIDRNSPFFSKLTERISFTEEEAIVMRRLLDRIDENSAIVVNLKKKIDRFYDYDILASDTVREQAAHNISVLHDAIKYKKCVVLRNYSSPNSRTVRDRIVEPFLLMNNNNEVRCLEMVSRQNKTFKVARMEDVMMLDDMWQHEALHRRMFTDIFMFSGEVLLPVRLRMGRLAYNILNEEYPQAMMHVTQEAEGTWILDIDVCSYAGIGRFVLGLSEDVQVIGGEGFLEYLRAKVRQMADKI